MLWLGSSFAFFCLAFALAKNANVLPNALAKLCYQNTNCGFFDYNGATLVCRLHSGDIYDGYQNGFCLAGQTNLNTGWIFSRINLGRGK